LNGPLSPRAARVLYNVADALAGEGAPPVDVAPAVEQAIRHRGVGAARRVWLLLLCIEWQPVASFRERRGFSWLPRERRRALLEGWERSGFAPRRRAFAELRGWIEAARAAALQSSGA
jgi:hypothetical protein